MDSSIHLLNTQLCNSLQQTEVGFETSLYVTEHPSSATPGSSAILDMQKWCTNES